MNDCLVPVTTAWLCENKVTVFRWIDNDNDSKVEQGMVAGRQVGRARGLASDVLISGRPDRPHGRVAPSFVPRSTFNVALSTSPLLPFPQAMS
jgi:hypothetical protein